jgi:hypothetical protein
MALSPQTTQATERLFQCVNQFGINMEQAGKQFEKAAALLRQLNQSPIWMAFAAKGLLLHPHEIEQIRALERMEIARVRSRALTKIWTRGIRLRRLRVRSLSPEGMANARARRRALTPSKRRLAPQWPAASSKAWWRRTSRT